MNLMDVFHVVQGRYLSISMQNIVKVVIWVNGMMNKDNLNAKSVLKALPHIYWDQLTSPVVHAV